MKVYYVTSGLDACYYVRCLIPLLVNGWNGDHANMIDPVKTLLERQHEASRSDVVVFHRPTDISRLETIKRLKQAGKKVVIDSDDTYKQNNGGFVQSFVQYDSNRYTEYADILHECMQRADMITTSTKYLANELKEYNSNVKIVKNMIYPPHWRKPLYNQNDIVRIGLVGSVNINKDIESIKPLLTSLSNDKRVQLVMFGAEPTNKKFDKLNEFRKDTVNFYSKLDIHWSGFVPVYDYANTLNELRLDLMLIPREENEFNKCKSNLKFLEASMLEIPVIASGFKDGPYQNDKHITLCYNIEQWKRAVEKYITNKKLRRKVGKLAKDYVLSKHDITKHNIYKNIYE